MDLKDSIFEGQNGEKPPPQPKQPKTKRQGFLGRLGKKSAPAQSSQPIQVTSTTVTVKPKHSVAPLAKRTGTIYTEVMVPLDPPAAAAIWVIMTIVIITLSGWTVMGKVIVHGLPWAIPLVVVEILLFDLMRKLHSRYNGGVALIGLIVSGIAMLALLGLFFAHTDTLERVAAGWYFSLFLITPGPLVALKWKETWQLEREKLVAQNETERLAIERAKSEVQADKADVQRNLERVSRLTQDVGEISDRLNSAAHAQQQAAETSAETTRSYITGIEAHIQGDIEKGTAVRVHALNSEGAAMKHRLQQSFDEEVDRRAAAEVAEAQAAQRRAEDEIERLKNQLLAQRYASPEPLQPTPVPQVILPDGSAVTETPERWVDPRED